jgi:glycosyltransferase involved in cell wall biosynthesis
MSRTIRVAIGSVPKDGGTFTFYRTVRPILREHGVEMFCVSLGRKEAGLGQQEFADDACVLLAWKTKRLKDQAHAFADWCEKAHIDIVIGINSAGILSALPYLPERIRVVARCANAFDHGYRITLSCKERLARIIALTPRLQRDLVGQYGADASKMRLIPNGIASAGFEDAAVSARGIAPSLRLGFLGRLEHRQKGVLFLPEIVAELEERRVPYELRIAGKGIHEARLRRELTRKVRRGAVVFVGALSPAAVPGFLAATDVFLFPSQFEGCPNALLEAMMAGCAPVCWRLEGITDFVVDHGATGLLAAFGDCAAFSDLICQLADNRNLLRRMAQKAAADARVRFTQERVGQDYATLFHEVMGEPPPKWSPKPWSQFRPAPEFRPRWTALIPDSWKRPIWQLMANTGLRVI